jgi:hypothetical protein
MRKAQLITHDDAEEVVFETDTGNGPKTKHEQKLEEILSGLNTATENAYIALYRQNGSGKESLTFLHKFPADKFEGVEDILEFLAKKHGGGDYRIHVRIAGRLAANNLVSVESPKQDDNELPRGVDPAINALLAQMEKQNQMIAALYQQMAEQAKAPSQSQSRKEMLEEMLMYKQLFGGQQSSGGLGQVMETIGFLKEVGVNVGGIAEEKEEGFSDILKNALPLLTTAMQQQPQPRPVQPTVNPTMQQQNALKLQIKMAVDTAVRMAGKGMDPQTFAEMVDAQLGENSIKLVSDPNIHAILLAYNPNVAAHRPWFDDVIEHIKAMNGLPSRFSSEYDDGETIDGADLTGGANNVSTAGDA